MIFLFEISNRKISFQFEKTPLFLLKTVSSIFFTEPPKMILQWVRNHINNYYYLTIHTKKIKHPSQLARDLITKNKPIRKQKNVSTPTSTIARTCFINLDTRKSRKRVLGIQSAKLRGGFEATCHMLCFRGIWDETFRLRRACRRQQSRLLCIHCPISRHIF